MLQILSIIEESRHFIVADVGETMITMFAADEIIDHGFSYVAKQYGTQIVLQKLPDADIGWLLSRIAPTPVARPKKSWATWGWFKNETH